MNTAEKVGFGSSLNFTSDGKIQGLLWLSLLRNADIENPSEGILEEIIRNNRNIYNTILWLGGNIV